MKETLFQWKKRFMAFSSLSAKRFRRMFVPSDVKDPFSIPIIINNRNRYTYLKQLVEWLEKSGYKNIVILDNDSTYPPLLEYYKVIQHRIVFLKKNAGFKALWQSDIFNEFRSSYYVYTDPDLVPADLNKKDVVADLLKVLKQYSHIEKAGAALKIDDLPDHYSRKAEVIKMEGEWWKKKVKENIYDAAVDTTFALYKPFAEGDAEECPAYRVAGNCIFRHLPWYENSASPTEEEKYYRAHVSYESSYWFNVK